MLRKLIKYNNNNNPVNIIVTNINKFINNKQK
jgi:hypothetical protein